MTESPELGGLGILPTPDERDAAIARGLASIDDRSNPTIRRAAAGAWIFDAVAGGPPESFGFGDEPTTRSSATIRRGSLRDGQVTSEGVTDAMRILILGASGMLGHRLWLALREGQEAVAVMRQNPANRPWSQLFDPARTISGVDLLDDAALDDLFLQVRPEAVVNAAGLIKQRPDGQDPLAAIAVNAALPHRLADRCRESGARLIHISTDCVFSGRRGMYTEQDLPDPPDIYGRGKLLGEVTGPGSLTLRTSIIGRELAGGLGLLEWFIGQRGGRVQGYRLARFSGVTTIELAETIRIVLESRPGLDGLWHLAGDPVDKFALLEMTRAAFTLPVEIDAVDGTAIDRSLDDARFRAVSGIPKPDWPAMLARAAADPVPYDAIRGTP